MFYDFFSFKQFMIFHFLNIKFSSSFFKRFNCFSKRCNFAFASRISFQTRNRFLCTLRMIKEKMTKSQIFFDATHVKHFLNASLNKHCLITKKQNLQKRMLMNNVSKFEIKNCFRWKNVRLLFFVKDIFHIFESKILKGEFNVTSYNDESISMIHEHVVTRILLELLDKRTSESRDRHARYARESSKSSMRYAQRARGSSESSMKKSCCVYRSRVRLLEKTCSTHLNYLVIAFIVEAYVISYWFSHDCPWQTSLLEQTQVILLPWIGSDLTNYDKSWKKLYQIKHLSIRKKLTKAFDLFFKENRIHLIRLRKKLSIIKDSRRNCKR